MRLIPSDPDVATIYRRIENGDLNLRPDFQRGEVWSPSKKQKLIDSILREWHVPPVHIIQALHAEEDEVLDGQQRLVSIRDFIAGKFKINGAIEPSDPAIEALDGLYFHELPTEWRRRFLRFPIRVFSIVDFSPSEPSELFYRLNQPVSLTAAEQRNSFFGKPREQIKELVGLMEKSGLNKDYLGFSNSRMAYDDVLARFCVAIENGLNAKVGSNLLADRYRSGVPFEDTAYYQAVRSVEFMAKTKDVIESPGKLNKASLFSWLVFFCRMINVCKDADVAHCAWFMRDFESERLIYQFIANEQDPRDQLYLGMFEIYSDRVTSRVADVSSVVLRDMTIWGAYLASNSYKKNYISYALDAYRELLLSIEKKGQRPSEIELLEFAFDSSTDWGRIK